MRLIRLFVVFLTYTLAQPALAQTLTGYQSFKGVDVAGAIFYPSNSGGKLKSLGGNKVWLGTQVRKNAELKAGRFPLIILSHGSGGRFDTMAWLAAPLAREGAIVIALSHGDGGFWGINYHNALQHDRRAGHVTRAIDAALADAPFAAYIDATQIAVIGYSLGGWTALSVAGVRGNLDGAVAHCKSVAGTNSTCPELTEAGLDLAKLDAAVWNASYLDPRVTHVLAIDPPFHHGLGPNHVSGVQAQLSMIILGNPTDRHFDTDVTSQGSNFAALLPQAPVEVIEPANHFSARQLCTAAGAQILKDDGEPAVCTDPGGRNRQEIHTAILRVARALLDR